MTGWTPHPILLPAPNTLRHLDAELFDEWYTSFPGSKPDSAYHPWIGLAKSNWLFALDLLRTSAANDVSSALSGTHLTPHSQHSALPIILSSIFTC